MEMPAYEKIFIMHFLFIIKTEDLCQVSSAGGCCTDRCWLPAGRPQRSAAISVATARAAALVCPIHVGKRMLERVTWPLNIL